jgi:drug/metabolite transporter (DMT)-like permease
VNAYLASWFLLSIACDVTGQLCFKQGMQNVRWVWLGVAIYAIEIVVWIRILSLVPLAIAFPIASLNFIAITLASWVVLGERIGRRRWAGTALVTAGVVMVAHGA